MNLLIPEQPDHAWRTVHDQVMGGVSSGDVQIQSDQLHFHGAISHDFGGGFASTNRPIPPGTLTNTQGIILQVAGDQREYQIRVKQSASPQAPSWRVCFFAEPGKQEYRFAWPDFKPVFRGRRLRNHNAVDPAAICQIGLMLNDGHAGAFALTMHQLTGF